MGQVRVTYHHVFSSEDDPEAEKNRVEETLTNVRVEDKERHVNHQTQPVHGH